MKEVFFTPLTPKEPSLGMGWLEIDDDAVKRLGIHHIYKCMFYGGISEIIGPDGLKFNAIGWNSKLITKKLRISL